MLNLSAEIFHVGKGAQILLLHDCFNHIVYKRSRQYRPSIIPLQSDLDPHFQQKQFNSLPNDKVSDLSKYKAFADDNLGMSKMAEFVYDRVEKIVEKGENAGYQQFLLFPTMFSKGLFFKVGIV